MKRLIKKGAVDVTLDMFVQNSSVTTGAGLTGLVFNSAGLTCYYRRGATGTATALTLATQTVGGVHADGGFVEIDATNMPGMYRLDLSDAIQATGVPYVTLMLKGATNMAPVTIELQLVDVDFEDTVRLGLTALPNVASGSAGAIVTSGTGTAQLSTSAGLVTLAGVTHTGAVIPTVTAVTNGVTVATNNDKTGYGLSAAAVQAIWDALTSALTTVGSIGKLLVDNINATISSRSSHSAADVWASATRTITGTAAGAITAASHAAGAIDAASLATDAVNEIADGLLDRNMATGTDSGTETVRTVRQALRVLRNRAAIAAGVLTVRKEDDTTASWTAAVTTTAGNPISDIDPTSV